MSSAIEQKKTLVAELVEKIKASKSVVAFKYQGLTVEKFQQLRRAMRANGCDVQIIKNNITRRAASELGYAAFADSMSGPIAIAFATEDMVAPAKQIYAFAKDNTCVEVVSGVVDGDVYNVNQLEELSKLPSYETLLTQLAAGMLGTVRNLAVALNLYVEEHEEAAN